MNLGTAAQFVILLLIKPSILHDYHVTQLEFLPASEGAVSSLQKLLIRPNENMESMPHEIWQNKPEKKLVENPEPNRKPDSEPRLKLMKREVTPDNIGDKFLGYLSAVRNLDYVNEVENSQNQNAKSVYNAFKTNDYNPQLYSVMKLVENLPEIGGVISVIDNLVLWSFDKKRLTTRSPLIVRMDNVCAIITQKITFLGSKLDQLLQQLKATEETIIEQNSLGNVRQLFRNIENAQAEYNSLLVNKNQEFKDFVKKCGEQFYGYPTALANIILRDNNHIISHFLDEEKYGDYFKWVSYVMSYYYKAEVLHLHCVNRQKEIHHQMSLEKAKAYFMVKKVNETKQIRQKLLSAFHIISPLIKMFKEEAQIDKGKAPLEEFTQRLHKKMEEYLYKTYYSQYVHRLIIFDNLSNYNSQYTKDWISLYPYNQSYSTIFFNTTRKFSFAHYDIGNFNRSMLLILLRRFPFKKGEETHIFTQAHKLVDNEWTNCNTTVMNALISYQIEPNCGTIIETMLKCYSAHQRQLLMGCVKGVVEYITEYFSRFGEIWKRTGFFNNDQETLFSDYIAFQSMYIKLERLGKLSIFIYVVDTYVDDCKYGRNLACDLSEVPLTEVGKT